MSTTIAFGTPDPGSLTSLGRRAIFPLAVWLACAGAFAQTPAPTPLTWDQSRSVYNRRIHPPQPPERIDWATRTFDHWGRLVCYRRATGETSSVVTCLDGHQMARQGRAGPALAIAAIASFYAGTIATVVMCLLSVPLSELALKFTAVE